MLGGRLGGAGSTAAEFMVLTAAQLQEVEDNGFIILPDLFSTGEVAALKKPLKELFADGHDANIIEKESGAVRTAMGLHLRDDTYARAVRHPRLIETAMQLRGPALYIQQVKVNVKAAFTGEVWQWHYDFATHHGEDGVPQPLPLNLHVFLDDVNDYNGPLYFIPGSHKYGPASASLDTETTSYPLWCVEHATVGELIERHGIVSATGGAGTALVFVDTLVHGSPNNMSPWDRGIFSLILNPVSNAQTAFQRPDYKHHRDFSPVSPLHDDCLIA